MKKLKLRRKNTQPTGRRVSDIGTQESSAPIVRYYRPQQRTTSASNRHDSARSMSDVERPSSQSSALQKSLKGALRVFSQWLILGLILALLVVNITLSGTSIRVKGSSYPYRTNEQYQAIINEVLDSRTAFQTKATLSSSSLEAEIRKRSPEVDTATAIIPLAGRRLQVILDVASPLVRLQTGSSKLAVVSSAGIVTHEDASAAINSTFSQLPSLSMVGLTPKVGEQILTQDEAALLQLLTSEFDGSETFRPAVQSLEFDVQKREIKARFKDKQFYAKITPEEEGRLQVGALVKTLKSLTEQSALPSEYVDVRVEDRVFVR